MTSEMMTNTADSRKADFKKTVDAAEGRRRRQDTTLKIRKQKREQQLKKKRETTLALTNPLGSSDSGVVTNPQTNDVLSVGNTNSKPTIADVPRLKALLMNPSASEQDLIEAARGFRCILSVEKNIPAQLLIDNGIVPYLVRNLSSDSTTLIFESAWALTNIASTEYTMAVVNAGCIKPLVHLLMHGDPNVREQSAWCLGNIAGEGPDLRDQVLHESAIPSLLKNVEDPAHISLLENVVWTISNLCRGTPSPPTHMTSPVIYPLVSLLDKDISEGVMVDVFWALSYLSDGNDQKIELVLGSGITSKLVRLLEDVRTKTRCKIPIVRILGNFVSGSDDQTQVVIDSGILNHLSELLDSSSKTIRRESSWLTSNIACGKHEQITALMKEKSVMKQIIQIATDDSWEVRKEALWAVSHICTSGKHAHTRAMVQLGGLEPLIMMLDLENVDTMLLVAVLDALRRILEAGEKSSEYNYVQLIEEYNGIESIENLQTHSSELVYEKVVSLIEDYFGVADEEDENLAPELNESGTFGFGLASPKELFPNGFAMKQTQDSGLPTFPFTDLSTNTFYPV